MYNFMMMVTTIAAFGFSFATSLRADQVSTTFEEQLVTELRNEVEDPQIAANANESSDGTFMMPSRLSVMTRAFAEVDLEIVELKVKSYVEFRFKTK